MSCRGGQHASGPHRALLRRHGFVGSMSRRANPYDNVEAVYAMEYETFEEVAADLPRFIDEVHTETHLHSALGHLSPARFEENHRPAPVQSAA